MVERPRGVPPRTRRHGGSGGRYTMCRQRERERERTRAIAHARAHSHHPALLALSTRDKVQLISQAYVTPRPPRIRGPTPHFWWERKGPAHTTFSYYLRKPPRNIKQTTDRAATPSAARGSYGTGLYVVSIPVHRVTSLPPLEQQRRLPPTASDQPSVHPFAEHGEQREAQHGRHVECCPWEPRALRLRV